jgi:hypothetical protein
MGFIDVRAVCSDVYAARLLPLSSFVPGFGRDLGDLAVGPSRRARQANRAGMQHQNSDVASAQSRLGA